MAVLTVGKGQEYSTISDAVNSSSPGDTVDVTTGIYTNDFLTISHNLTLVAVGGLVTINATVAPPNGKAIIDEGGSGVKVAINGFELSGAVVPDGNGAGIRYEGGTLSLTNDFIHGNQDGILAASDPGGSITIDHSEFAYNGSGTGYTHNIYINQIANFTLTNSLVTRANVGHEVKSRAANNLIQNNRILDGVGGTASYDIDLPNGGNATITGNVFEKARTAQNPIFITSGEEGDAYSSNVESITGNTFINDDTSSSVQAVKNVTGSTATFGSNSVWNLTSSQLGSGITATNTSHLSTEPALDLTPPYSVGVTVPPVVPPTAASGLVVNVSEDAYLGDAQFTVKVDGAQVGGVYTATASHAAGKSQAVPLDTVLGLGTHNVEISFINDAYGGTVSTDRNLYILGATYDGQTIPGSTAALFANGPASFGVTVSPSPSPVASMFTLNVSEDAWMGDAQFIVEVDGKRMGSTYTATSSHAGGQTQAFTFSNIAETFKSHDIAVSFINAAYGGTPRTDRNLYVDSIQFDRQSVSGGSASLFSNSTHHFTATAPANWTG